MEPYMDVLLKQEDKLRTKMHRAVINLRKKAHQYASSYMALSLVSVLAAVPAVQEAIANAPWSLPLILEDLCPSLKKLKLSDAFRWPRDWAEMDGNDPNESKAHPDEQRNFSAPKVPQRGKLASTNFLTHDLPEFHLWFVGTGHSSNPYDPILRRRVGNLGRALLRLILPMNFETMEDILGDLELDVERQVESSLIAFHEKSFSDATTHVTKWLEYHPMCRKLEVGLSRAWRVYRIAGGHTSTVNAG
ncbi:hypothetical protein QFC19_008953 [Naganishia cerealis]|uniref:Uncharacterized protein n=1 Tax=Naganishia cerealis TaxID=610337 RepID=A0ACC2UY19_9TREE|nr:hypothetical protein QFC19_008953 [Naganishia cerealis]